MSETKPSEALRERQSFDKRDVIFRKTGDLPKFIDHLKEKKKDSKEEKK